MIKNLKKLRLERGYSQKKLGELLGVSQQSINKYENHSVEPDIQTLITLSDYFGTSVDYLIGHTDIPHAVEPTHRFDLTEEEAEVIDCYRLLNKSERQSMILLMKNYLTKIR